MKRAHHTLGDWTCPACFQHIQDNGLCPHCGQHKPTGRTEETAQQTAAPLSKHRAKASETAAPVSKEPQTGHGSIGEADRLAMVIGWIRFKWLYLLGNKGV
jgi:hypothetical protein